MARGNGEVKVLVTRELGYGRVWKDWTMLRAAVWQILDENERVNGAVGFEDSSERIMGPIDGELAS